MNWKQKIGIKVIFGAAFPVFLKLADSFQYWINIIQNKTFNGEINGEFWLRDQILDKHVYLDVGFNRGEWSKFISQNNPQANIFAFDPCIDVINEFSLEKLSYKNIILSQIALSDEKGSLDFYDYGNLNGCNSLSSREIDFEDSVKPNVYKVSVDTLDSWVLQHSIEHIDFLKIDAEGYDLNVLEGGVELLNAQAIDLILFEYATGWLSSKRTLKEAVDFFEDKPYDIFRLFNGFLLPFTYETQNEGNLFSIFIAISYQNLKSNSVRQLIRKL